MAFWIPLAMAGAGALMGRQQQKRAESIEDADRKLAAETERYSWVTGNKAQPIRRAPNTMFGSMGQGALSWGLMGANLKNAMGGADAAKTGVVDDASATGGSGTNAPGNKYGLGAGQMYSDLGKQGDNFWKTLADDEQKRMFAANLRTGGGL